MRRYTLRVDTPVAELDPFDELRASALVRLLQLAASNATTEAGYDVGWYARNHATWIVRYTSLERRTPARQGETLEIDTWVSDFRRVRSLRQYEVRNAEGGEVARAVTDWVFVDTDSGSPATPPQALQQAFMPDGIATAARPPRIRPPGSGRQVRLRPVELADLDSLGHVNNARYVDLAQQSVVSALADCGWQQSFEPAADHLRMVGIDVEYRTEATYGQLLTAQVEVSEVTDDGATAEVAVVADGSTAACARTRWQWSRGRLAPEPRRALDQLIA